MNNEICCGGSSEPSVSIKAMTINSMNRSVCWYSSFIPYWQYQRGSLLYAVLQAKFFFNTVMKQYFKHIFFGREFGGFEIFISPWRISHTNLYNSLQSSQLTYFRELFTIQPTRSTRSSSCLTLSRPPVTSHLTFSKRVIFVTAPRLWNDLPPELRTFSLPPPLSL